MAGESSLASAGPQWVVDIMMASAAAARSALDVQVGQGSQRGDVGKCYAIGWLRSQVSGVELLDIKCGSKIRTCCSPCADPTCRLRHTC